MAEEKKTRIITSGSHYSIRANIDDRDRVTGDFVVIDDVNRVTQRVNGKGQLEPNTCHVNCDYNGIKKAEGFKNGLATISYTTPTAGRDDEYGGDDAYSRAGLGGKYELSHLPRLRKTNRSIRA